MGTIKSFPEKIPHQQALIPPTPAASARQVVPINTACRVAPAEPRLAIISFRSTDDIDQRLTKLASVLGLSKSELLESVARRFVVAQGDRQRIRAADRAMRTKEIIEELHFMWGKEAA